MFVTYIIKASQMCTKRKALRFVLSQRKHQNIKTSKHNRGHRNLHFQSLALAQDGRSAILQKQDHPHLAPILLQGPVCNIKSDTPIQFTHVRMLNVYVTFITRPAVDRSVKSNVCAVMGCVFFPFSQVVLPSFLHRCSPILGRR